MHEDPTTEDSITDEESGRAEAEVGAETAETAEGAEAEVGAETVEGAAGAGASVAVASEEAVERGSALVLAGLHLRLGSLALARAELETLAGRGALDASARIDLAEVRWRTGDLVGGGEAAREALAGGGDAVVALVVAAEAASALGRPSEARRLAGKALTLNDGPIDPIFAGMPRSSVWPGDPAEPVPSPTTLFPPERSDPVIDAEREGATLTAADDRRLLAASEADADAAAAEAAATPREPGLWDLHEAASVAAPAEAMGTPELEPSALFDAGRAALEDGDLATAAVHLGLVVRVAPGLAPAVLSIIGEANDAGLLLVQGDAYRAVGHEIEARRAYAAAMAAASAPARTEPPPRLVTEDSPAASPFAAPAETGLWWLEPQREIGSGPLEEFEREAPGDSEAEAPAESYAPLAEPATEAESVAAFDLPAEPGPEPATAPEPAAEPEAEPEPEPAAEPQVEREWRAGEDEHRDDEGDRRGDT